jgi:hypothetical protein|tara:strand:- start:2073 stop:2408 length:336 start_codon:yes stop_codon:yes gene_type:complete
MTTLHKYLTPDDFVIIIKPIKEEENGEPQWTGEVQVSIVTNTEDTTLSAEEFSNMLLLCNFAAASIPAMEENNFVRELIEAYVQKNMLTLVRDDETDTTLLTPDSYTKGSA